MILVSFVITLIAAKHETIHDYSFINRGSVGTFGVSFTMLNQSWLMLGYSIKLTKMFRHKNALLQQAWFFYYNEIPNIAKKETDWYENHLLTLKSSNMMQPMLQTSQGWDQPNSKITSGAR